MHTNKSAEAEQAMGRPLDPTLLNTVNNMAKWTIWNRPVPVFLTATGSILMRGWTTQT